MKIRYKKFTVNRQSRLKHSYKVFLLTKNALMWYHINSYIKVQMRFFLRQTIFHLPETDFPFCAKRFHHLRQDGHMQRPDQKLKDGLVSFSR